LVKNLELRKDWLLIPSGKRMVTFSPDGSRLAITLKTGWRDRDLNRVLVYDLTTGYLVCEGSIGSKNSFLLGFIEDGRLACLSHADQGGKSALKLTLLAVPRTDWREEFMIDVYSKLLGYSDLSRDGAFIRGTCGEKGSEHTYIYNVAKRNLSLHPRPSEEGRLLSQWCISPDGNLLALEYVNIKRKDDATPSRTLIRLFDVSAGGTKELSPPIEGASNGQAFEFSPDGQHIISSSSGELRVWYLGAGSERVKTTFDMLADKPHDFRSMRISHGAAMLALMTGDHATIVIWDIVNE
jgi:WD40 repeat protein